MSAGHIILIEGHSQMRNAVKDLLLQDGMDSIVEFSDPILAIGHLRQQNAPAVIILDATWAEINGFWFARLLRKLAPQSKILLLLDDSRADYQEAARDSGADACIAKSALAQNLMPTLLLWKNAGTLAV
jgi:DNA-binding NarL/FixJ family response regulator